ncbi:DUF2778 domain-containing protein [Enterobacillus tribolii]|nr:DUF2778 domain-containing protein [Enterobacillus tribolii]
MHGRFHLNGADFAPLIFPGIGIFAAYSGDTPYRNQPGCIDYAGRGPLPIGRYWIVSRLSSG